MKDIAQINVRLPAKVKKAARVKAADSGITMQDVLLQLIEAWLEDRIEVKPKEQEA